MIPNSILNALNAQFHLKLNTNIEKIDKNESFYTIQTDKGIMYTVDDIIIAAPLELANITFGPTLSALNLLKKRTFISI